MDLSDPRLTLGRFLTDVAARHRDRIEGDVRFGRHDRFPGGPGMHIGRVLGLVGSFE